MINQEIKLLASFSLVVILCYNCSCLWCDASLHYFFLKLVFFVTCGLWSLSSLDYCKLLAWHRIPYMSRATERKEESCGSRLCWQALCYGTPSGLGQSVHCSSFACPLLTLSLKISERESLGFSVPSWDGLSPGSGAGFLGTLLYAGEFWSPYALN